MRPERAEHEARSEESMRSKLRRLCSAVMAIAIICSIATAPAQASEAPQFSDVDGHWGEEAIVRWADYGVIEGSNGQFNPDAPITRAEMAAAIARLLGLTETAENTFTDVEAGAWYAQAILRLLELSACREANAAQGLGALTFLHTKRRLGRILTKPAPWRERLLAAGLAGLLVLALVFSAEFSRQHFYPYPAYSVGTESGAQ